IPTVLPYLLPRFVHQFVERYPDVDLYVKEYTTDSMVTALREEKLDAGICATPLNESGIREKTLFYEAFRVYANTQHQLLRKGSIMASDLLAYDIWLLYDGHCLRNQVISFCSVETTIRDYPNLHFQCGSLETLRQLIRSSCGYTLVPQMMIDTLPA